MGLFTLNDYKSDEWKAEYARITEENSRVISKLADKEKQMERVSDFLISNSKYRDSFEYKKMELNYQLLKDEVDDLRRISGCLENDIYQHNQSW